jgi:hypothetical protein
VAAEIPISFEAPVDSHLWFPVEENSFHPVLLGDVGLAASAIQGHTTIDAKLGAERGALHVICNQQDYHP